MQQLQLREWFSDIVYPQKARVRYSLSRTEAHVRLTEYKSNF